MAVFCYFLLKHISEPLLYYLSIRASTYIRNVRTFDTSVNRNLRVAHSVDSHPENENNKIPLC